MIKKIVTVLLVVALTISISIGGTLAYLSDKDAQVNTFTTGNVYIDLWEDFGDNSGIEKLLPAVGSAQDDTIKNAVEKEVYVTNTGSEDAYVRVHIAIPSILDDGTSASANILHFNYEPESIGANLWDWSKTTGEPYQGDWNVSTAEIDGVSYNVYTVTYGSKLAPGVSTVDAMSQVYMDSGVTNELITELKATLDDEWKIYVCAEATQAEGFADAYEALNEAFGVPGEYDINWTAVTGGETNEDWVESESVKSVPVVVGGDVEQKGQIEGEEAEEILEILASGQNLLVDKKVDLVHLTTGVDAQGATVTMNGTGPDAYGYLAFIPEAGTDVAVSNLNVTGSGFVEVGHYGMGGGNYTLNNVKIENLASTLANGDKGFTLGCAFMSFGNATLNDCVMTGTTAVQDGVMPVDLGCGQDLVTNINRGEYGTIYCWSKSTVTINGAEVNTIYTAPSSGSLTIKAGTHVSTINVDYGTVTGLATNEHLAKIIIEDGAQVDAIVFNGETYSQADWVAGAYKTN